MQTTLNQSNQKNNVWSLIVSNFYSYDSMETRSGIFSNEKEAFMRFSDMVKDYYNDELEMASELFDKEITSLEEIIKEIEKVNNNYYMKEEYLNNGNVNIKYLDYSYGIELLEDFKKFTISRIREEVTYQGDEKSIEEVYIILRKIDLNELNGDCECLLDNYKDVDNFIKR